MKNIKYIVLISAFLALFANCEEGDVFTGSPVDDPNQQLTNVDVVISTTATVALTDQKIPFTVTLVNKTFNDTINVEATALSDGGRRRRAYVEILPNQTTATGEIFAAGGDIYSTTFTLAATAIELYTVEPGKHYLVSSNVLNINTGNTSIPVDDTSRLQIKLSWPDASTTGNNLRLVIDRPDPITDATTTVTSTGSGITRLHYISNSATATTPNSNTTSNIPGEYILQINASRLNSTPNPTDLPYRIVINYPDSRVEVYEGIYQNLYANDPATPANEESPLLPVLKVTKTVTDGVVTFSVVQI